MKNKNSICLYLALLCVWSLCFVGFQYSQQIRNILPAVFVQAWDKDKPAASTSLRNSQPEMLANQSALETALAQDHEFSTGGTNSGKHEVITFEEESAAGASSTNEGHLQVIDGGSQPEMAFTSEDGAQLQFTKDGDLYSSGGLTVVSPSTFNGNVTLGDGDDLLLSTTSDITISGNTFTVAGATGDTVVAGTLTVTGVATLGASSQLASSVSPTTDADIAPKAYVDNVFNAPATTVFNTTHTASTVFQDLDLSQIIGSNTAMVFLQVNWATSSAAFACRPNGQGSGTASHHLNDLARGFGASVISGDSGEATMAYVVCSTDSSGIMEHMFTDNSITITVKLMAYVR
ncbi:hypothetical protein LCGC14_1344010 [marine sediment metagenome]|uniref:Uncharacterized protein n=1 Tax=marine sediment metagenome TaxID=412755 RepID=A0A0F9KZ88_9ZZZZ